jgi:hypothetical protein
LVLEDQVRFGEVILFLVEQMDQLVIQEEHLVTLLILVQDQVVMVRVKE